MRHLPRVILAVLIALAAGWWLWRDLLTLPPPAPAKATLRQRQFGFRMPLAMLAKLERPLPTPFLLDGPFDRVLKDLGKTVDVEVETYWGSVKLAGISKNAPVRLDVSGRPLGDALLATLEHVGGKALACQATGDGVVVATADDLSQDMRIAVYDVREFRGPADQLMATITSSVDPESWWTEGRPPDRKLTGFMRHLSGQLIVTQTEANQREVDHLIYDLRRARRLRMFAIRTSLLSAGALAVALVVPAAYRRIRTQREPWQCDHCGYDLRASTGRCPECGNSIGHRVLPLPAHSR